MNPAALLQSGHIDLWILLLGLVLPRLALFLAAFVAGDYPHNTLPLLFNFIGWLFIPRFLMAYYIYTDAGTNNIWFWAYIILGIAGMVGEGGYVHRRVIRRTTTVNPDGSRTVVEEEEV
jgi:hypothetical protein